MRYFLVILCCFLLQACASLGIVSPWENDPLTGGKDAPRSTLLEIALPAGFQYYSDHSYSSFSGQGPEGLETYRGTAGSAAAAQAIFSELSARGWQLSASPGKGKRTIQIYRKGNELACVTQRPQGQLTILEIWRASALPDGSRLVLPPAEQNSLFQGGETGPDPNADMPSLAGEEYGPIEESGPAAPQPAEQWGNKIEERTL